ncbi:hypothetical protein L596_001160 [Steinernema carpocapsae]|uniref:Carboxypeptidase n=1 Tax=Steinernema carpocapsae TaxID=34508 RepID=A0A4U8UKS2_STECR|nr:hypothetical protein L596_001160 [Steinernema carpocapsae]
MSLWTVLFLSLCAVAYAVEIHQLPGAPSVSFKQYAGYFDVGVNKSRHLHYWFVESQNDAANDPLLLFLYGGPGCSGLSSSLTEWGPFRVNPDGRTLHLNEHSWNTRANILLLEAPAGVGFSYADNGDIGSNDTSSALEALRGFFTEFPQFQSNDLFLTGVSYAGIYIPTLGDRILKSQKEFHMNLKGYAIGNGMVSEKVNTDTVLLFAYNHAMISERLWQQAKIECCNGAIDGCPFHTFTGYDFCGRLVANITTSVWTSGVNPYNVFDQCSNTPQDPNPTKRLKNLRFRVGYFQVTGSHLSSKVQVKLCVNDTAVDTYLNSAAAREAFFVPKGFGLYETCNMNVTGEYTKQTQEMEPLIANALDQGLRVFLMYGDADMACNFLMAQRFVENMGRKMISEKKEFMVNGQVGGFHTAYEGVEFVTVRGADHNIPLNRPVASLYVLNQFLQKQHI